MFLNLDLENISNNLVEYVISKFYYKGVMFFIFL